VLSKVWRTKKPIWPESADRGWMLLLMYMEESSTFANALEIVEGINNNDEGGIMISYSRPGPAR
jgi:hypothetical protein